MTKSAEQIATEQAAAAAALASVKTLMTTQATTGTLAIGAPVMGLEATSDTGASELLAGDPIPAAPSKNPDVSTLIPTETGAINFTCAWIALIAVAFSLW